MQQHKGSKCTIDRSHGVTDSSGMKAFGFFSFRFTQLFNSCTNSQVLSQMNLRPSQWVLAPHSGSSPLPMGLRPAQCRPSQCVFAPLTGSSPLSLGLRSS